jgi:hypothetical protein
MLKPLGMKAYGSIPHLPESRIGPGDHHVHPGQAAIATRKTRDRHDIVLVQEKLDGSCVAVALLDGVLIPMTRSGWPALTSPYVQHQYFAQWVYTEEESFRAVLREGERICGEWLAQVHSTRYHIGSLGPFVAFDIIYGMTRLPYEQFLERINGYFSLPHVLFQGRGACRVSYALDILGTYGYHGAIDVVEGCVWRVERKGVVDFLCKYVRPGKIDGCYLPDVTGGEPEWNWHPSGLVTSGDIVWAQREAQRLGLPRS